MTWHKSAHRKGYLVAIPIPSLGRDGQRVKKANFEKWARTVQKELTECFGGATRMAAPGANLREGDLLYERDQVLVVSACDNRRAFLKKRSRIATLVRRMGEDLDQESVFVLACPSDSFLIEIRKAIEGSRGD